MPLRKVLKLLLELPNVFQCISDYFSLMENLLIHCECQLWKSYIMGSTNNEIILPLLLHYDDYETAHSLGSHATIYMLGGVYVSLAWVLPQFSSSLENIFLASISHSEDRSYFGNRAVFQSIIQELKRLEKQGIQVKVDNHQVRIVYFRLIAIIGENLALNYILGFNERFNSNYYCRFCRITKNKASQEIGIESGLLRTKENYEKDLTTDSNGVKELCVFNDHKISTV